MTCLIDWFLSFFTWIGFTCVSRYAEPTRTRTDDFGTRKGTVPLTRQSTTTYQENNNNLIRQLAAKSNVVVDNQNLKMQVAKLEFKLALSKSKIRNLKNEQDELVASKTAMETRLSILEEENLRLIEQETKSRRVIEHKDRLLEVISLLSSDNTGNSIGKVFENKLIGLDEKNKEVLGLLTTSKTETQIIPDAGCETTPVEEIYQPNPDLDYNGLLADYTHPKGLWWSSAKTVRADKNQQLRMPGADFPPFVPEVIIMDRYLPPPVKSPPFVDNRKVGDVEYVILTNLPPLVNGADIVEAFEIDIGPVEQYTMFADENGHYSGTMGVVFVHPPDARRAYKACDGMMFGLPDQRQYKAEVAYFINGERSYQKEEDRLVPVVMDGVFVADWINPSPVINFASTICQAGAVVIQQMQETWQGTIVNHKEQPESPTTVDAPSGPEALAVDHQETLPGAIIEEIDQVTTTTHLEDSCEVKNQKEEISALITLSLLTRKQKINKRTSRRKKASKKNQEAASPAE